MTTAHGADVIVALLHMAPNDPEITYIIKAVRSRLPHKPLVLLTGHDHKYSYHEQDSDTVILDSECYAHSVGHLTFEISPKGQLQHVVQQYIASSSEV